MKIPSYLYRNRYSGIYIIENKLNGKRYIGSSENLYNRLHKHNSLLNNNKHQNSHLQNSWIKNGTDNFECYMIEKCKPSELTKKEQYWIDELKPEYNFTLKVERNVLSQESREKISKTLIKGYKSGRIKKMVKPIRVYDLKGNFIKEFPSRNAAAKELNTHVSSIIRVLTGQYKQANGYTFKCAEESAPVKSCEFRETPEMDNPEPSLIGI